MLGALRNCDAILVVLRAFDDGGVEADPAGDLDALELELVMADLDERRAAARPAAPRGEERRQGDRRPRSRRSSGRTRRCPDGTPLRGAALERRRPRPPRAGVLPHDQADASSVLNTGEKVDADAAPTTCADAIAVPIDIEAEIAACAPEDRAEMREMYGVGESALDTVAQAAYHLLGRRTFLTTGEDESRAWTFRAGAKAPECAGVIHSDLQRGFIRAEVIDWQRAARDRFVGQGA